MRGPRLLATLAAILVFFALHAPVLACSVCYGTADDPFVQGSKWTMIFMLALTYGVIGGGVLMAVVVRRGATRREEEEDDHPHLRLVSPAAGGSEEDQAETSETTEDRDG